jgi:TPR repeat protein
MNAIIKILLAASIVTHLTSCSAQVEARKFVSSSCAKDVALTYVGEQRYSDAREFWSSSEMKGRHSALLGHAVLSSWDRAVKSASSKQIALAQNTDSRDIQTVIKFWTGCANNGELGAMVLVGTMYTFGPASIRNENEGERWLHKAELLNHPMAAFGLSDIYLKRGERESSRNTLMRMTINYKDITARKIGDSFLYGSNVQQDHVEAAWWFRLAAEAGDAYSQLVLGDLYQSGLGVPMDKNEAKRWYLIHERNLNIESSEEIEVKPLKLNDNKRP